MAAPMGTTMKIKSRMEGSQNRTPLTVTNFDR